MIPRLTAAGPAIIFCCLPIVLSLLPAGGPWGLDAWAKSRALVETLSGLPYVLFPLSVFLAVRMHQVRAAVIALLLFFVYGVFSPADPPLLGFWAVKSSRAQILALALPAGFSMVFVTTRWIQPARLLSLSGFALLALALFPLVVVVGAQKAGFVGWLELQWVVSDARWALSDLSVFFLLLFILVSALQRDRTLREFNAMAAAALVSVLYIFNLVALVKGTAALPPRMILLQGAAFSGAGLGILYAGFRQYWRKAYRDELTALPNRRALDEEVPLLPDRYVWAMVDVDHFKKFNDTYGHDQGDHVLQFVAAQLHKGTGGRAYRYGGEEFSVILPFTTLPQAQALLETVRSRLAAEELTVTAPGKAPEKVRVTVSVGLASHGGRLSGPDEVQRAADQALYEAKRAGRNRVVVYTAQGGP